MYSGWAGQADTLRALIHGNILSSSTKRIGSSHLTPHQIRWLPWLTRQQDGCANDVDINLQGLAWRVRVP